MSDLFTSYRYDLGENTSVPLNMAEFFNQPVMEAPLEINCPVDLKIYDESGTLLGEVKDDAILLGSEHFILSVVEDKKSLLLRKDMTYIIEITGYDEGTMDMQLLQSEGEDSVKALAYKDVSVSPETTLTAELRNGVLSLTDGRSQVIEPEVISADELQMVEIAIETDDENVTVKGSGSYIAGQQILLMANNSDKNAVFAGWYEDDVLVARSATACISCDRSMTLTPKYLEDVTETMILAVSHDSNSVTATVVCSETAVLYAAAYDENGQMLWTNSASAVTGVIEIPAPASVLGKVHEIRAFLLEPATMRPLCQYGN